MTDIKNGKYICYWGSGTVGFEGKALSQEEDIDYFLNNNGYYVDTIERIKNLEPGECLDASQHIQTHSVVCLEKHNLD